MYIIHGEILNWRTKNQNNMKKLFLTIIIASVFTLSHAQTRIENVSFKQVGNNVVVTYDLYCNGSFDAQLYYTTNEGATWHGPLNSLTGDVNNVKQGYGKSIKWNVLKDQDWLIGDEIQFKVAVEAKNGTFTDTRDNHTYKWVKIGKQKWMAENLNYNIGDSWCYDNNSSNCSKYGRLYTWETAKKACPDGWHLPTDIEWKELVDFIASDGYSAKEGTALKSTSGWNSDGNGTDNYDFTALPGGFRFNNGTFNTLSYCATFWSATEYDSSRAWSRYLYYHRSEVYRRSDNKDRGFSGRCVQD